MSFNVLCFIYAVLCQSILEARNIFPGCKSQKGSFGFSYYKQGFWVFHCVLYVGGICARKMPKRDRSMCQPSLFKVSLLCFLNLLIITKSVFLRPERERL